MTTITKALLELVPDAKWTLHSDTYAGLEWLDNNITKPTEQEVNEKLEELVTEAEELKAIAAAQYELVKYKDDRKRNYPSIGDQLDALWKGGDEAAEMLAKVQAVKTKYPKPE